MSNATHLWFGLPTGAMLVATGLLAINRPDAIARRNQDFIENGKDDYFEQRRAWKAYGFAAPDRIRRWGWFMVIVGAAAIVSLLATGGDGA